MKEKRTLNNSNYEDRINEILDGADGIDFDPKAAGYTEIAPGFWEDGGDFGDLYVETEHLDKNYKRNVSSDDNFYWLSKKSFMMPWAYILLFIIVLSLLNLWYTISYRVEEIHDLLLFNNIVYFACVLFTFVIVFGDLTFISYHYDRKKNRIRRVSGEIWFFSRESLENLTKWGEATRYFPESLRIQRSKIFFRELHTDFVPQCEKCLNPYLNEKISKQDKEDLKKMIGLKYVFTSKKYQMFKKLFEADPDMQYEIVYYEKSKVIKEIRPLANKVYSAEALEIMHLINRMYP